MPAVHCACSSRWWMLHLHRNNILSISKSACHFLMFSRFFEFNNSERGFGQVFGWYQVQLHADVYGRGGNMLSIWRIFRNAWTSVVYKRLKADADDFLTRCFLWINLRKLDQIGMNQRTVTHPLPLLHVFYTRSFQICVYFPCWRFGRCQLACSMGSLSMGQILFPGASGWTASKTADSQK